jgi:D-alanine-D-alanine ligase
VKAEQFPALLLYNLDPAWPSHDIQESQTATRLLIEALIEVGHSVQEVCVQSAELEKILEGFNPKTHLIFNWCEELPGIPHSGSLVARILDTLGFTYTGASAEALALSQDKRKVKVHLSAQGIPTPKWEIATHPSSDGWEHFPAIVKPAFEHCSFGITRDAVVLSPDDLAERVAYVLETFKQPALIEEFIDGREFHVAVLGNGAIYTLPPAEMDFSAFPNIKDRLCTYDSKFDPSSASYNLIELRLPAPLTQGEQCQIEAVAVSAYRTMGCRDYARMDLRLRDGIFYVLDVNPNADLSPDTSLALAAEMAGLSYGQLGSMLVNLAALRHPVFGKRRNEPVLGLHTERAPIQ